MRRGDIAPLHSLAALKRDRELETVREVVTRINGIEADLARITTMRDRRQADTTLDPARLGGADLAWDRWCETRMRQLQARLAALRVEHETALAAARKAFGRADALRQLADRQARGIRSTGG